MHAIQNATSAFQAVSFMITQKLLMEWEFPGSYQGILHIICTSYCISNSHIMSAAWKKIKQWITSLSVLFCFDWVISSLISNNFAFNAKCFVLFYRKWNLTLPLNYPSLLRWIVSHQQKKHLVITSPRYASCARLSGISLWAKQIELKLRLLAYPWPVQAKGGEATNITKVRQTCSYGWILGAESGTSENKIHFYTFTWILGKSQGKRQTLLKFLVIVHCSG